jgi:hypothetical protein
MGSFRQNPSGDQTPAPSPPHVSREAADLAKPGWDVTITLIRQRGTWKVLQVGNVYPH